MSINACVKSVSKDITYPRLMIRLDETIIAIVIKNSGRSISGTVVYSKDSHTNIGTPFIDWSSDDWKDFTGILELKNTLE